MSRFRKGAQKGEMGPLWAGKAPGVKRKVRDCRGSECLRGRDESLGSGGLCQAIV